MSDYPPNQPAHGDPQLLPKGTVVRPSADRMPFGPSGELLPAGPKLPAGFMRAPDIAKFNWTRKRGNEWTDATLRTEILTYIAGFFATHSWARSWAVAERTSEKSRGGPYPNPVLVFTITDDDGASHEVAQEFPEGDREGSALAARLTQVTLSLEALHP